MNTDPAEIHARAKERVLTALAEAAQATGDARFTIAAGIVRGRRIGRKTMADDAAVAAVREMLLSGIASSIPQAAALAVRNGRDHSQESAAIRIARKYRAKHRSERNDLKS